MSNLPVTGQNGSPGWLLWNTVLQVLHRRMEDHEERRTSLHLSDVSRELHGKCFEDKNATRRINKIMVYCPNRSACGGAAGKNAGHQRCQWTGELKSVDDHLKFCNYQVVHCPNDGCNSKLERHNLLNHLKIYCVYRNVRCKYCLEISNF